LLPRDLPNRSTVQRYFYAWQAAAVWKTINVPLLHQAREPTGREASPSAGVIDSQSVKTTQSGGPRGDDAGKKINGRKRPIITDTVGHLVAAKVHTADIQDRDGAPNLLASIRFPFPWLRRLGCAMSSPMAAMLTRSWQRLWPDTASGRSKSSSGPIAPLDFTSCRGAGGSNQRLLGSTAIAGWRNYHFLKKTTDGGSGSCPDRRSIREL
jgi:Transposase DDE domain